VHKAVKVLLVIKDLPAIRDHKAYKDCKAVQALLEHKVLLAVKDYKAT
jgi:hypothetical protein